MMNYLLNLSQHSLKRRKKLILSSPSYHRSDHIFHIRNVLLFLAAFVLAFSPSVSSADIGKYFTRSPQSIVAPPGDRVTFQCETNIPTEQVRWKLNGRFLHPANDTDIRVTGTFLVVKVSKNRERYLQQVGDYQCVVEFGADARGQSGRQVAVALTSVPAQLSIAQMDGFVDRKNTTLEVVEGNNVAIHCDSPYSNPSPIIQFFKDGLLIESETGNAIVMDSGALHLHNVSTMDTGNYGCTATNHITSDTFAAPSFTHLIVKPKSSSARKAPEFLVKPKPYFVVPQDGNVTLECVAVGNPPPFVTWRKLRAPTMINYQSSRGNLHLFNMGFSQEGEYICEAFNGVGDSLTTLSTIVLNSLPNITKEPANLVVEEGGEAILDCSTEGLPKPRVYWVFNGENIDDNGNVQITDTGLRIASVEKKHAGLFQCFATNPMGTVSSPAELKVMPKQITAMASDSRDLNEDKVSSSITPPATRHFHHHKNNKFHRGKHNKRKHKGQDMIPPSKPIMNRISDNSVMVRWSVPPNSGYPIQFFKIQYKEVSKRNSRWMTIEEDIPPHIHSFEVKDFRVGHAYRFRIAAVYSNNDNKVGPNSDKFVLQKDTSMKRPTFVPVITTTTPTNTTSILLRWKYMRTETVGLDGYFIYYRESTTADEYSKMTVLGFSTESAYITHLKPGTSYDMKVQAFNKAGASNFSSIITAKTLGVTSEHSEDEHTAKKESDLIPNHEDIPAPSENLYVVLGCIFAGFWIILCVACALCYKCKQKKAEEDAKYPCEASGDIEAKSIPNGHAGLNGHPRNGYIPTIAAHLDLDDKETSFVERHNNNQPVSPSQLNSSVCELGSFSSAPVPIPMSMMDTKSWTELRPMKSEKDPPPIPIVYSNNSRNNSLQRKKHHHHHHQGVPTVGGGSVPIANGGSLRRGHYTSCSSEDLDSELGDAGISRDAKIFPKEHYKQSRRHSLSRKRNSMVDG